MLAELPRSSVVNFRCPVPFEVTLEIDPTRVATDSTVGIVGLHLVRLGGNFIQWNYRSNDGSALAEFSFASRRERDEFLTEALQIPGVALRH